MDALCSIRGAHIYGNRAGSDGDGIAIVKGSAMIPRTDTIIEGSIIASNMSRRMSAGIFYKAPETLFSFTPVFRNNEIVGHSQRAGSAGLTIEGVQNSVDATIERNVFRAISDGLKAYASRVRIDNNWFEKQDLYQIDADSCHWTIMSNELDGGGTTAIGINVDNSSWWSEAKDNDIHGHVRFGFRARPPAQRVDATRWWWGHPAGPTLPPGPVQGDVVTPNVRWRPVRAQRLGHVAPAALALPRFQSIPPPNITFTMPSEFFPNLACDAKGEGSRVRLPSACA
jgi:hypothetical protein